MARVMLVGSDGEVRKAVARILVDEKIAVMTAEDPADAIARVTASGEAPDLVLVDRRLARGRETELIDCIRSRAQLQDVPVVLYTVEPAASHSPPIGDLRDAFDARLVLAIVEAICN
jgi:CheY-like chemotaxis protein